MMNPASPEASVRCPACDAENSAAALRCRACGRTLAGGAAPGMHVSGSLGLQAGLPPWHGARREPMLPPMAPSTAPPAASGVGAKRDAGAAAGATPYFDRSAFTAGPLPSWLPPEPGGKLVGGFRRGIRLAVIFVIGAASGAAALWWSNHPAATEPAAIHAPDRNPEAAATNGKATGISAGELPYDGGAAPIAPPVSPPAAPTAPAAPGTMVAAPPTAAPVGDAQTMAPADAAQASVPAGNAQAPAPAIDNRAGARLARAAGASERRPHRPRDSGDAPERRHDKVQVASERSLTPQMLAQCNAMTDGGERQLCRREVCQGKWGENGCPPNPISLGLAD